MATEASAVRTPIAPFMASVVTLLGCRYSGLNSGMAQIGWLVVFGLTLAITIIAYRRMEQTTLEVVEANTGLADIAEVRSKWIDFRSATLIIALGTLVLAVSSILQHRYAVSVMSGLMTIMCMMGFVQSLKVLKTINGAYYAIFKD
jgi:hypothetical protein